MTIQDLAKLFPDPPPEHDASNLLASAFAALSIPESENDLHVLGSAHKFSIRDKPLDEATKDSWRGAEFLKQNQTALDAVPWDRTHQRMDRLRDFAMDFPAPPEFSMHPLSQVARIALFECGLSGELGHGGEAARQLLQQSGVVRVLEQRFLGHYIWFVAPANSVYCMRWNE